MKRLDQMAVEALARTNAQPAIEFAKRWISWGDMRHVAERVINLLEVSGASSNSKIVLVARNRPSAIAAFLGLIAKSYPIRMVYPFQSAAAIARDIEQIEPSVVIAAADDYADEIFNVLRAKGIAAIALEEMDAFSPKEFERSTIASATSDVPQIEILTSGTTGAPKPFALSYDVIAEHIVGTDSLRSKQIGDPAELPPTLMFFPVGNISGFHSTLPPLLRGQRAILLEKFSVAGWHDHLVRFRPAAGGMPPAGIQMVLDANLPREDFSSLRFIGTGAAPLDPSVQHAFEEKYGVPIMLAYGATEFGGPVAGMTPDLLATWGKQKLGSVGKALPGAQLRVVDSDTGKEMPPGKEGVLEVISPRIGPQWIRTSDIAVIDADGFMFHRGRADGAIMRGGFKVLPETIERALLLHPALSVAGVVGISDRRLGQVPAAAIQLKPGVEPPTVAELESHLRNHVPATHIPVVWQLIDALPRTPTMKVDRPALRRLLEVDNPF
jgi:long-chain acyl-CoA synthetase